MKKIISIFLIFFTVASCGFRSIYHEEKSKTSYEKQLASIKIQKDAGTLNQELRFQVYDLLNPNKVEVEAKYYLILHVSILIRVSQH